MSLESRLRGKGVMNQSRGIIGEYEEMLTGERQAFSVTYLRNGTSPEAVRDLLQFVFGISALSIRCFDDLTTLLVGWLICL